ncbi:MAG: hypothetical protein AB1540_10375 [Bdellovibrionota bacterium]
MTLKKHLNVTAILFVFSLFCFNSSAHALDKRLKLMFKTAGYGAAAGAVIGAGTIAMGLGNFQNVLMGASSGMYAGILLAGYIVFTQDDYKQTHYRQGPRNPYAPKRPAREEDWEEGPEENYEDYIPPDQRESSLIDLPDARKLAAGGARRAEFVLWTPVFQVQF